MMRAVSAALVVLLLFFGDVAAAAAEPVATFGSEQEAHKHCPADVVVWLNLPTGVYHFRGQRWYGATKSGAYVCQKEADMAGDRATRNGQ